jgi:hypothetical protein
MIQITGTGSLQMVLHPYIFQKKFLKKKKKKKKSKNKNFESSFSCYA